MVALREQADAERAVMSQLERDLKQANARASEAEEKAELIRLTLEEKNINNSAISSRPRRGPDPRPEVHDAKATSATTPSAVSTFEVHCQTSDVVILTPAAHNKLKKTAHDYCKQNETLLKERNTSNAMARELLAKKRQVEELEAN